MNANASRVNDTGLDLHSRSQRYYAKCSIISESDQAMPITFAVKTVRLKINIICSQSDELDLHSRSQLRLKVDKGFNVYLNRNNYIGTYLSYGIQTWHEG